MAIANLITGALKIAAAGFVLGLLGTFPLVHVFGHFPFGLRSLDLWGSALTALVVALVIALSAYFPGRRITRLNPADSLKGV